MTMRADLDWAALPERMRALPISDRGYPVPWFVEWVDGVPEFRAMDTRKWVRAVKEKLCWVCGQPLGAYLAFVIGPMCGINRTTSEPPCHRDCAEWSAKNCPFLSRPHMVRRENDLPEGVLDPAGMHIPRNPGVMLIWITRSYKPFKAGLRSDQFDYLIEIGDPVELEFWTEGRRATPEEVERSVETGLPALEEVARMEHGGERALAQKVEAFRRLYR